MVLSVLFLPGGEGGGGGRLPYEKVRLGVVKDSGVTLKGVHDEMSLFLTVKVFFRLLSKR